MPRGDEVQSSALSHSPSRRCGGRPSSNTFARINSVCSLNAHRTQFARATQAAEHTELLTEYRMRVDLASAGLQLLLVDSVRRDSTCTSSHLTPQSVRGWSRRKKEKGGDNYSDSGSDTSYRNAGMVGQAPHSPAVEMQSGGSGGSKAVQSLVRPRCAPGERCGLEGVKGPWEME
jgi:hypothetical protein